MVGKGKRAQPTKTAGRRKKPKSEASSSAPPPPWIELPEDMTANILQRLSVVDILEGAQKVCTTWRRVCKDPSMFRKIHISSRNPFRRRNYEIMCCHAVDRSQGQLLDLAIHHLGDDLLLEYVAQRSPQLRCLTLGCSVTAENVVEATKKFPMLEELQLFYMRNFSGELIEQVGRSCPKLKSLTLKQQGWKYSKKKAQDSEALAIAKTMPGLRHLCLFGNRMSNEGLVAILDACVHLESLDLRLCSNVDLSGDLAERCSRQIKSLKKSSDFTANFDDFPLTDTDDDADAAHDENYDFEDDYRNDYANGPYGLAYDYDSSDESDPEDQFTPEWLKMHRSLGNWH